MQDNLPHPVSGSSEVLGCNSFLSTAQLSLFALFVFRNNMSTYLETQTAVHLAITHYENLFIPTGCVSPPRLQHLSYIIRLLLREAPRATSATAIVVGEKLAVAEVQL